MNAALAAGLGVLAASLATGWPRPGRIRASRILGNRAAGAGTTLAVGNRLAAHLRPWWAPASSRRAHRIRLVATAATGTLAGLMVAPPGGGLLAGVALPTILHLSARKADGMARMRTQATVVEACVSMASELRAGRSMDQALRVAGRRWPHIFGAVTGRLATGGDPVTELRRIARRPGAEQLAAVAAAVEVSGTTGASMADTLTCVADALRDEAEQRHEARSQLATARATARLLAVLPIITVALFSTGERRAIDFLLTHPVGLACLVAALVFVLTGLAWVERVSRTTLQTPWQS